MNNETENIVENVNTIILNYYDGTDASLYLIIDQFLDDMQIKGIHTDIQIYVLKTVAVGKPYKVSDALMKIRLKLDVFDNGKMDLPTKYTKSPSSIPIPSESYFGVLDNFHSDDEDDVLGYKAKSKDAFIKSGKKKRDVNKNIESQIKNRNLNRMTYKAKYDDNLFF